MPYRIQALLCGELEKLQGQIQERETYLAAYQQSDKNDPADEKNSWHRPTAPTDGFCSPPAEIIRKV